MKDKFERVNMRMSNPPAGNGQAALMATLAPPRPRMRREPERTEPPPGGPVDVTFTPGVDAEGQPGGTLTLNLTPGCQNAPRIQGVAAASGGTLATQDSAPVHKERVRQARKQFEQSQRRPRLGKVIPRPVSEVLRRLFR